MENLNELREKLATLEHEQWMHWSQTLGERINFWQKTLHKENEIRNVVKLDEIEFRMKAQLDNWEPNWISYAELDEATKDFDRVWADKAVELFASFLEEARKELKEMFNQELHSDGVHYDPYIDYEKVIDAFFGVEEKKEE